MIGHLSTLIESFPGAVNQTRCFAHILNLVAKSILRQFDDPEKMDEDLSDAAMALEALAQELESVSDNMGPDEDTGTDELELDDDDENGLAEDRGGMSVGEIAELEGSVAPIRLMLTKVTYGSNPSNSASSSAYAQTASYDRQCDQKLFHYSPPSVAC